MIQPVNIAGVWESCCFCCCFLSCLDGGLDGVLFLLLLVLRDNKINTQAYI